MLYYFFWDIPKVFLLNFRPKRLSLNLVLSFNYGEVMLTFKDFKSEAAKAIDALDFEKFQEIVYQIVEEGLEDQEDQDFDEKIVEEDIINKLHEKLTREAAAEDIIKIIKIINLVFDYNNAVDQDDNYSLEDDDPLKNACNGAFPDLLLNEDNYATIMFHKGVLGLGDDDLEEFNKLLSYALVDLGVAEEGGVGATPDGGEPAAAASDQEDEETTSDEASLSPRSPRSSPLLEPSTQRERT